MDFIFSQYKVYSNKNYHTLTRMKTSKISKAQENHGLSDKVTFLADIHRTLKREAENFADQLTN